MATKFLAGALLASCALTGTISADGAQREVALYTTEGAGWSMFPSSTT